MALSEPLERGPLPSHYQNSYRMRSQTQDVSSDSNTESDLESDSDPTPSPTLMSISARPTGGSDDDSLYQSLDEENSPDDQVCSVSLTQGNRI